MANTYFIYEGRILRAAQPKITGAIRYYKEGRKMYKGTAEKHNKEVTFEDIVKANVIIGKMEACDIMIASLKKADQYYAATYALDYKHKLERELSKI